MRKFKSLLVLSKFTLLLVRGSSRHYIREEVQASICRPRVGAQAPSSVGELKPDLYGVVLARICTEKLKPVLVWGSSRSNLYRETHPRVSMLEFV